MLYQYNMWGQPEQVEFVPVPKYPDDRLTEVGKVALRGFKQWLEFWGLERGALTPARLPNYDAQMVADGGLSVERLALKSLEEQSRMLVATRFNLALSFNMRCALTLEKFFLKHMKEPRFYMDYDRFVQRYVPLREVKGKLVRVLTPEDALGWIADRMGIYAFRVVQEGRPPIPDAQAVYEMLEQVSLRMTLAESLGYRVRTNADIRKYLVRYNYTVRVA